MKIKPCFIPSREFYLITSVVVYVFALLISICQSMCGKKLLNCIRLKSRKFKKKTLSFGNSFRKQTVEGRKSKILKAVVGYLGKRKTSIIKQIELNQAEVIKTNKQTNKTAMSSLILCLFISYIFCVLFVLYAKKLFVGLLISIHLVLFMYSYAFITFICCCCCYCCIVLFIRINFYTCLQSIVSHCRLPIVGCFC